MINKNKYALVPLSSIQYSMNEFSGNTPQKKITLSSFAFILILTSFLFNGIFIESVDPLFVKIAEKNMKFLDSLISKPYLITIGTFKTQEQAKDKALELLPKLKQVNIVQLQDGSYAFRIDTFPTKRRADRIAQEYKNMGIGDVKVIYQG